MFDQVSLLLYIEENWNVIFGKIVIHRKRGQYREAQLNEIMIFDANLTYEQLSFFILVSILLSCAWP